MSKKSNNPEASLKHGPGKAVGPEKGTGKHETGKDNSECASLRPNHPAKAKERAQRQAEIADQRIVHEDNTRFPEKSTAASAKVAARRRKD